MIGDKKIKFNYIPALNGEDKYYAIEKKTQFFVIVGGDSQGMV